MAYELRNGRRGFLWGFGTWGATVRLAVDLGWKPQGTKQPVWWDHNRDHERIRDAKWDGSYLLTEGQSVGEEDAAGLAAALRKALPLVPDDDAMTGVVDESGSAEWGRTTTALPGLGRGRVPSGITIKPLLWFSGPGKQELADFIDFCEEGGFEIW